MHSRVFQVVSASDGEMDESELLTSDDLYHDFACEVPVADYVMDQDEQAQCADRERFFKLPGIHPIDKRRFKVNKKEYFGTRLAELKKAVAALTDDGFCSYETIGELSLYHVETLIKDRCGDYIYTDYAETMDEWIRWADEDEMYVLGNVLDYHF